jgi:hypothetical protein
MTTATRSLELRMRIKLLNIPGSHRAGRFIVEIHMDHPPDLGVDFCAAVVPFKPLEALERAVTDHDW